MPLFGKKKSSGSGGSGSGGGGYPKQQSYSTQQPVAARQPYPTQQQYPGQSAPYPSQPSAYPQQSYAPQGGPPPPYQPQPIQQPVQQPVQSRGPGINTEDLAYLAVASPYYGYGYGYGGTLLAAAALSGGLGENTQGPVTSVQQPSAAPGLQVSGVYDQGARFDSNRPANIPPPPPGVAPTAAQMAAAQGQTVQMTQQRRDHFGMGSDGGATFF